MKLLTKLNKRFHNLTERESGLPKICSLGLGKALKYFTNL